MTEETKKRFQATLNRFLDDNPGVDWSQFVFSIQHDNELMSYLVSLISDQLRSDKFHELFGIDAELRGR
jgi:hypothetical protein